jgi:hypothetical protein
MERTPRLAFLVLLAAAASAPGCSINLGWTRPDVWVEESERFDVGAASLDRLELLTRNGAVRVRAHPASDATVHVTAIKRAGGDDEEEARAALRRLDVVRRVDGGVLELKGDWEGTSVADSWSSIGFEISLPARLDLRLESHNGAITVEGTEGEIALLSHNGRLEVDAPARRVSARTHNGAISYRGAAEDVTIETHNGRVEASLSGAAVSGRIETHNGAVALRTASAPRGTVEGGTRNGAVSILAAGRRCTIQDDDRFRLEFDEPSASRLEVETSNGAIEVR